MRQAGQYYGRSNCKLPLHLVVGENEKIILELLKRINSEIGNLNVNGDNLKQNINEQRSKLNDYINNLKDDKKKFDAYNNSDTYHSVIGQAEVSHLVMRSNYLQYIIWAFLLLFLLFEASAIKSAMEFSRLLSILESRLVWHEIQCLFKMG